MKITIQIHRDPDTDRLAARVVQGSAKGDNLIPGCAKKTEVDTAQRMAKEAITKLFRLIDPPEISWILPTPPGKLERVK